eukprot:10622007-Ditylum_brightwellii.AAC.1
MANADMEKICLNTPIFLTPTATPTIAPSNTAYLQINKVTITNNIAEAFRGAYTVIDMECYIKKKTGYSQEQMDSVDWDSLGSALNRQTLNNQIKLVKFMRNWINTGQQKKNFDELTSNSCPVFEKEKEIWTNIFQCTHSDSAAVNFRAISQLQNDLFKNKNAPIISQILVYKLSQWI